MGQRRGVTERSFWGCGQGARRVHLGAPLGWVISARICYSSGMFPDRRELQKFVKKQDTRRLRPSQPQPNPSGRRGTLGPWSRRKLSRRRVLGSERARSAGRGKGASPAGQGGLGLARGRGREGGTEASPPGAGSSPASGSLARPVRPLCGCFSSRGPRP